MQLLEEKIKEITKEIQNETDEKKKKNFEKDIASIKAKDEEIKAKDDKNRDIISKSCWLLDLKTKGVPNPTFIKSKISEADVTFFFNILINDVLLLCGLGGQLQIQIDFSITSFKVYILIIAHRGIPKGVIQLKRPCDEFSEESYGQLFDYMFLLQQVHGVSNIFGIISCYFKTRIAWLDGNKLVETEKVEQLSPISIPKLNSPLVQQIQVPIKPKLGDHPKKDRVSHQLDQTKEIKRFLFVSPEITHTDQLNKFSFTGENKDDDNTVSIEYVIEDIENKENYKKIYLISDLGSGVEGKAWLAINTQAKAFVIKFFAKRFFHDIEEESKRWYDIWGIKTLVLEFNNEFCLLIPFF
ncbi:hypothetical protein ACTFIR_000936 [Dictyostelium discoideum]